MSRRSCLLLATVTLLIACGALAREILALKSAGGWDHVDLTCLPAILHNHPEKITKAVEDAVAKHRDHYEKLFVVYADCGTGGHLQAACARLGVEMVEGPHCYSFFEGNELFASRDEFTAFYLTDFLARQFDAFVWKPLGLDRHPELIDAFFGHYHRIVLLTQTGDEAVLAAVHEPAYLAFLGLFYAGYPMSRETCFVGGNVAEMVQAADAAATADRPPFPRTAAVGLGRTACPPSPFTPRTPRSSASP